MSALPSEAAARVEFINAGHANLVSTLRHGKSRKGNWSPEYYSWASMIQRCTNPARNVYALYGGRGITVCERWMNFDNFLADMGERKPGTSLGRINGDDDYSPGNCEWQSDALQSQSRRNNKLNLEMVNEIRQSSDSHRVLAKRFGVSRVMIDRVIKREAWV
ncbi:MAG TPA: hypothetical protein VGV14_04395 [Rhodanobacter sp.]|nr:hypothetical protein [Rhodanobacter sp.]